MKKQPSVAIFGVRGVPAQYGGGETWLAELGPRLVERGWRVIAYCRPRFVPREDGAPWRGVERRWLPSPARQSLDTIVHSGLATLDSVLRLRPDAALIHARGNAPFAPVLRAAGIRPVLHVDGFEWERAKWGGFAHRYHRDFCEPIVGRGSAPVIVDAPWLQRHYQERWGKATTFIPYGSQLVDGAADPEVLRGFGLVPGRYALFVGRLVPEKGAHHFAAAGRLLPQDFPWPLVIVGDNPYDAVYVARVRELSGDRVKMLGGQYGETYWHLMRGAGAYVNSSEVEGLSPGVVAAMSLGVPVVASDIVANAELVGETGSYFRSGDPADLARALVAAVDTHTALRDRALLRRDAVRDRFAWEGVADETDAVLRRAIG